jgi:hypothetical protein
MHVVNIASLYVVSIYTHHSHHALRILNFTSTTIHTISVMNNVHQTHSNTFSQQLMASWSHRLFLIYIVWLPHISLFSSLPWVSMIYHMHHSKCRPSAPGLNRVLCSWIHGNMRHDSRHSYRFTFCINHSIYCSYDITDLYFIAKYCLKLTCCFFAWQ